MPSRTIGGVASLTAGASKELESRMEIERKMCTVKCDVVFKGEFQLPTQHSSHRLQTRPKQTVMHDQEIDILF